MEYAEWFYTASLFRDEMWEFIKIFFSLNLCSHSSVTVAPATNLTFTITVEPEKLASFVEAAFQKDPLSRFNWNKKPRG